MKGDSLYWIKQYIWVVQQSLSSHWKGWGTSVRLSASASQCSTEGLSDSWTGSCRQSESEGWTAWVLMSQGEKQQQRHQRRGSCRHDLKAMGRWKDKQRATPVSSPYLLSPLGHWKIQYMSSIDLFTSDDLIKDTGYRHTRLLIFYLVRSSWPPRFTTTVTKYNLSRRWCP